MTMTVSLKSLATTPLFIPIKHVSIILPAEEPQSQMLWKWFVNPSPLPVDIGPLPIGASPGPLPIGMGPLPTPFG